MGALCQRQSAAAATLTSRGSPPHSHHTSNHSEGADCITSMAVERSSNSGYPTSITTPSVSSEQTRACSQISKSRSLNEAVDSSSSPRAAAVAPRKAGGLSTVVLDANLQHRLRHFYTRNLRAQKRHATMIEQQKGTMTMESNSSLGLEDRLDLYDVFSPDERSTRWQEFQELLAGGKSEYDSYRETSKNVRGSGKAMTIAGVRPNPNPTGKLPIIH